MSNTINTNTYSLNAQRNLSKNAAGLASALERLSSGLRVNSAKDDAAGLAIGMDMEKSARAISADIRASSDVISKAQVADGALAVVGDMTQRIAELVKQQGNANLTSTQSGYLKTEIDKLVTEANTIQDNAKFNGTTAFTKITISCAADMSAQLGSIANQRATEGATINNEEFKIQSYKVNYENTMAARSRIMDADFAEETSRLARFQILQQAGTAMVAQANAVPQNVLSLLR